MKESGLRGFLYRRHRFLVLWKVDVQDGSGRHAHSRQGEAFGLWVLK